MAIFLEPSGAAVRQIQRCAWSVFGKILPEPVIPMEMSYGQYFW